MSSLIWPGNAAHKLDCDKFITLPMSNPECFNSQTLPINRILVCTGRPGTDKRASFEQCVRNSNPDLKNTDFPCLSLSVEYGQTTKAIDMLKSTLDSQINIMHHTNGVEESTSQGSERVSSVIIIERADILLFEPDSQETMLYMLNIKKKIKQAGALLILLFDRVLNNQQQEGHGGNSVSEGYRKHFINQIDAILYKGELDFEFRMALFKEQLTLQIDNNNACLNRETIVNRLSDGDYINLADNALKGTTPQNIRDFMRRVFYDLTCNQPNEYCKEEGTQHTRCVNMNVLENHMTSKAMGNPHLLGFNGTEVEDTYSIAAGKGSSKALLKPNKYDGSNITTFDAKYVGKEAAEEEIKVKKEKEKKKRKLVKEEEEEEEDDERDF